LQNFLKGDEKWEYATYHSKNIEHKKEVVWIFGLDQQPIPEE
jgi:hypothetical protein